MPTEGQAIRTRKNAAKASRRRLRATPNDRCHAFMTATIIAVRYHARAYDADCGFRFNRLAGVQHSTMYHRRPPRPGRGVRRVAQVYQAFDAQDVRRHTIDNDDVTAFDHRSLTTMYDDIHAPAPIKDTLYIHISIFGLPTMHVHAFHVLIIQDIYLFIHSCTFVAAILYNA